MFYIAEYCSTLVNINLIWFYLILLTSTFLLNLTLTNNTLNILLTSIWCYNRFSHIFPIHLLHKYSNPTWYPVGHLLTHILSLVT